MMTGYRYYCVDDAVRREEWDMVSILLCVGAPIRSISYVSYWAGVTGIYLQSLLSYKDQSFVSYGDIQTGIHMRHDYYNPPSEDDDEWCSLI